MKKLRLRHICPKVILLVTALCPHSLHGQASPANLPPQISLLWPQPGDIFGGGILIKIKAQATDADGSIAQVRFFADTNLLGVVTNAPFNLVWAIGSLSGEYLTNFNLKAVAVDNLGLTTESSSVRIYYSPTRPPMPVLEIVSPRNGAIFSAPGTFVFSAELLASTGDTGPVEFFVGTNSVGIVDQAAAFTATTPPSSLTVSNLLEGDYTLMVRYLGINGSYCTCNRITNTIRVVKLGVQSSRLTADRRFEFEVVTSFPGVETIVQASSNLMNWIPISTNVPSSNTFTFTESYPANEDQRFYRVSVAPE